MSIRKVCYVPFVPAFLEDPEKNIKLIHGVCEGLVRE